MTIELEDLIIYPLNSEDLSLWLNNDIASLEKHLKCSCSAFLVDGLLEDYAYSQFI